MPEQMITEIIKMSAMASVLSAFIFLLRGINRSRLPNIVMTVLWFVLIFRLIVPVSISSQISFYNFLPVDNTVEQRLTATSTAATGSIPNSVSGTVMQSTTVSPSTSIDPVKSPPNYLFIAFIVWICGFTLFLSLFIYTYILTSYRFKKTGIKTNNPILNNIMEKAKIKRNVKLILSDRARSPIVFGVFRPKIILPLSLNLYDTVSLNYIFTHELVHIKRFDNLSKFVFIIALCVHWFNPLVWISFFLFTGNRLTPSMFMGFGEASIKTRINGIMKYKKTTVISIIVAILLLAGNIAIFATNASASKISYTEDINNYIVVYGSFGAFSSSWGLGIRVDTDKLNIKQQDYKYVWTISYGVLKESNNGAVNIPKSFGRYTTSTPSVIWNPSYNISFKSPPIVDIKTELINKKTGKAEFAFLCELQQDKSYAYSKKPSILSDTKLIDAINKALDKQGKKNANGEFVATAYIPFYVEEKNSQVTVYMQTSEMGYQFLNNVFVTAGGCGAIPTVAIFKKSGIDYSLVNFKEGPEGGSGYAETMQRMFPSNLLSDAYDPKLKYASQLQVIQEQKAKDYLKSIGRDQEAITSKPVVSSQSLSVSQVVLKQLMSYVYNRSKTNFKNYIGTTEIVEQNQGGGPPGFKVRSILETKEQNQINGKVIITFTRYYQLLINGKNPVSFWKYVVDGDKFMLMEEQDQSVMLNIN
jgi:beta-lactamase regulating signal transducer with metallopeptidase domain